jgi:hypothetical protein
MAARSRAAYPGLYAAAGAGGDLGGADLDRRAVDAGGGGGLNAGFVYGAWRIWLRDEDAAGADKYATEKQVFSFSLLYLFLHFAAFLAEAALKPYGLGGW